MIGDEMPGQVAGRDDGVVGFVGNAELAQLPLHRIRRPRRVGDEDDGAALLAERVQRLAGLGKRLEPVMDHAPDVARARPRRRPTRSRSRSTKRSEVMAESAAGQPGPAARRASAALPVARDGGSMAGRSSGSRLAGAIGCPAALVRQSPRR